MGELSYTVLIGHVKLNGVRYGEGELIPLSVDDATRLLKQGIVDVPEQEGPEIGKPRVEVPTISETEPTYPPVSLPPKPDKPVHKRR